MISQFLWIAGSSIFLLLGFAHLRITFFGKKLFPKDESTEVSMKNTYPRITKETTMWRAWTGFNASHSAGAIFFGSVNIVMATQYYTLWMDSAILLLLNFAFVIFFLYLGKVYWFKIPFVGILLTLLCFVSAILIEKL